jgi:hypothetical protein
MARRPSVLRIISVLLIEAGRVIHAGDGFASSHPVQPDS